MEKNIYDMGKIDIAWCPGCGNFSILRIIKDTLAELGLTPNDVVLVSGIGQAAKIPHYLKCNFFNGLHGRALPAATGIKAANPQMTIIAQSGDGDMYGEGGNHFMHAIRRNPDITNIVHNNMVYGLTKGQASPTSQPGFVTPVLAEEGLSVEHHRRHNPRSRAARSAPARAQVRRGWSGLERFPLVLPWQSGNYLERRVRPSLSPPTDRRGMR